MRPVVTRGGVLTQGPAFSRRPPRRMRIAVEVIARTVCFRLHRKPISNRLLRTASRTAYTACISVAHIGSPITAYAAGSGKAGTALVCPNPACHTSTAIFIVTLRTRRTSASTVGGTGGTRSVGAVRAAGTDVGVAAGVATVDMCARGTGTAIGMVVNGVSVTTTGTARLAGRVVAKLTDNNLIGGVTGLATC